MVPLQQLAALSRDWYAGRLDEHYAAPPRAARMALLAAHGFVDDFWQLP